MLIFFSLMNSCCVFRIRVIRWLFYIRIVLKQWILDLLQVYRKWSSNVGSDNKGERLWRTFSGSSGWRGMQRPSSTLKLYYKSRPNSPLTLRFTSTTSNRMWWECFATQSCNSHRQGQNNKSKLGLYLGLSLKASRKKLWEVRYTKHVLSKSKARTTKEWLNVSQGVTTQ